VNRFIDFLLNKSFPQDHANHYMRGSVAASWSASIWMLGLLVGWLEARRPLEIYLTIVFVSAAVVGWLAAYTIGRWKEDRDRRLNDEAVTRGELPPHGVETADWQFTAWGAMPVCVALIVAQFAMWAVIYVARH
jgi:hypothetical protein